MPCRSRSYAASFPLFPSIRPRSRHAVWASDSKMQRSRGSQSAVPDWEHHKIPKILRHLGYLEESWEEALVNCLLQGVK
eukprot:6254654-Ditylum_brightwellii.AAC.1